MINLAEMTARDEDIIAEQIGRIPRGVIGVAWRCPCGKPGVIATAPRLPDGSPFPTFYYLTNPEAIIECSRLEASGIMAEMTARIAADDELAAAYTAAHQAYLADRKHYGDVPEIANYSAGGMPNRVKCLHALVGHALAAGPGVNPIGDEALALFTPHWHDRCAHDGADLDPNAGSAAVKAEPGSEAESPSKNGAGADE